MSVQGVPKTYVIQISEKGITAPFDGQNLIMEPSQWASVKNAIDDYYRTDEWQLDNLITQENLANDAKAINKAKPKIGFIYFVQAAKLGVKIGFTTNLESRMKSLQTASPHLLELISFIGAVDSLEEFKAHEFFKEKKIRGEWFNIDEEEIYDYIHDLKRGEYNGIL